MTTQPSRAEWWREVTDPDEVIQEGRWYRIEFSAGTAAAEYLSDDDKPRSYWHEGHRVFVDSRWNPPLKVGDEVNSWKQLDSLPIRAIVLDASDDVWQKREPYEWVCASRNETPVDAYGLLEFSPFTLIYLPEGAGR